jgi:hypothetical protein
LQAWSKTTLTDCRLFDRECFVTFPVLFGEAKKRELQYSSLLLTSAFASEVAVDLLILLLILQRSRIIIMGRFADG